jgi:hypothetical protein
MADCQTVKGPSLDIHYFYVQDLIARGVVKIEHCSTEHCSTDCMVVDFFY